MSSDRLSTPSYLFTVRLWCEDLGDGQIRWRGQVKHVLSGEAHWFRDWKELLAHFEDALERCTKQERS